MTLAYRAISRRERTEAEVRAFLERKELEEDAIEYALGELRDAGALDDARFARLLAEDKRSIDGWGAARIDRELRRRGVPDHLAEAERGRHDRDDELRAAVQLLGRSTRPRPTTGRVTRRGGCWCARATSPSWPTTPSASTRRSYSPRRPIAARRR